MGCLTSQDENISPKNDTPKNDKNSNALELPPHHAPHVTMSTYDPGNLSITRPSVMKDYQFTKKQGTKNNGYRVKLGTGELKLRKAKSKENIDENDIEEHNQRYIIEKNITELNNINLFESAIPKPRKRIVFISIVQLNSCIDNVPKYILEESLFMFKAQRAWFFPSNSTQITQSKQSIRHRLNWNELFLQQLEKKDKLGHVLWFEDGNNWEDISLKLTQIRDIYSIETIKYYKPLLLNEEWWINNYNKQIDNIQPYAHYLHSNINASYQVILEEINVCELKFNPAMEIIYQSNPTLVPMKSFNFENFINQHYRAKSDEKSDYDCIRIPHVNAHCIQNSGSIGGSEERSNKNLVGNIEMKYDMTALALVESNTCTNTNVKGMKMMNQYSITDAPSNSINIDVPAPLDERKSNRG